MKSQRKIGKFLTTIVIISVILGVAFSLLFALLVGDPFEQVLPIGFWFGPLMGLFMTIMRFTTGRIVEDSITYDGKEDFPTRLKSAFDKVKYRLETENGNVSEWKCVGDGWDQLILDNVTVQLGDASAIVIGPKSVVKKLKEAFEALKEKDTVGTFSQKKTSQAVVPQQWRIEPVKDSAVAFDCLTCQEHYKFDATIFAKKPDEQIEGLTKTDQVVGRVFGQQILAIVVALVVYYFAHRWINGPDMPLNQGILIPVFIAVVAYSIAKPLFSGGLFTGNKIPVYRYKCSKCQSEVLIASNGKLLALPVHPSDSGSGPETN